MNKLKLISVSILVSIFSFIFGFVAFSVWFFGLLYLFGLSPVFGWGLVLASAGVVAWTVRDIRHTGVHGR